MNVLNKNTDSPDSSHKKSDSPKAVSDEKKESIKGDDTYKLPTISFKDLDFTKMYKDLLEILKLNSTAIVDISNNEKGAVNALIGLLLGAIGTYLGSLIFGFNFFGAVVRPSVVDVLMRSLVSVLVSAVFIFIMTFVSVNFFKGVGSVKRLFNVVGLSMGINFVFFITPLLGSLGALLGLVVGVWLIVVNFYAVKHIFKLDTNSTIFVLIISYVLLFIVGSIVGLLGVGYAVSTIDFNSFRM